MPRDYFASRALYTLKTVVAALEEEPDFVAAQGTDLVTRVVQYGANAVPPLAPSEVNKIMALSLTEIAAIVES